MPESEVQKTKRKRLSANQVRLAVRRLKNGEEAKKIASELGVHPATVGNWKKKAAQRKYRTHNKTKPKAKVTPVSKDYVSQVTANLISKKKELTKEVARIEKLLRVVDKIIKS